MPFALCIAAIAGAWLYAPVIGGLLRQWLDDPAASYGLLLAGTGIVLAARRWRAVQAIPSRPAWREVASGAWIVAGAMGIYLLGTLMGELFVQRVSLPLALGGSILAIAGSARLRPLRPAVILLALAIPLPAVIVTRLTLPLQLVATGVAASVLDAAQIPVVRQGNLLVLDTITLEVVEACNGLRSVLSLFAVAAVCSAACPIGRWRGLLMWLVVIPVGILGNGARIAATGIMATWFGPAAARGFVHELTGVVAFAVMCAAVLVVLPLTRGPRAAVTPVQPQPVTP